MVIQGGESNQVEVIADAESGADAASAAIPEETGIESEESGEETSEDEEDFRSSHLGTKEHWDAAYERELRNFREDGDPGEVWFGEDSLERVLDWMDELPGLTKDSSVLDVGCGNGVTLVNLASRGWTALTGCDYSATAVDLARGIATQQQLDISYHTVDLLLPELAASTLGSFQVIFDKGTFDAIALREDGVAAKQLYTQSVEALLAPGGNSLFLLTSCNFVRKELVEHFAPHFVVQSQVKYPTFSFGGAEGSTITTLAFRRAASNATATPAALAAASPATAST